MLKYKLIFLLKNPQTPSPLIRKENPLALMTEQKLNQILFGFFSKVIRNNKSFIYGILSFLHVTYILYFYPFVAVEDWNQQLPLVAIV